VFEAVLADAERVFGSSPNTVRLRSNLADAYRTAGRLGEAIPLSEQSLADSERVLGASHPSTLRSRGKLARTYRDAGRMDEALSLFGQAAAGLEEVLGAEHPSTIEAGKDLAAVRQLMTAAGEPTASLGRGYEQAQGSLHRRDRTVAPFERAAREIVSWCLADPARQVVDERLGPLMDTLAADFAIARGVAD
jgi:tetratricopeptide (TPR) repeat protein